jgi:hypothetical protein
MNLQLPHGLRHIQILYKPLFSRSMRVLLAQTASLRGYLNTLFHSAAADSEGISKSNFLCWVFRCGEFCGDYLVALQIFIYFLALLQ